MKTQEEPKLLTHKNPGFLMPYHFETYYRTSVIKTVWVWGTKADKHVHGTGQTDGPEIDPDICGASVLQQRSKSHRVEEANGAETVGRPYPRKEERNFLYSLFAV